MTITKEQAEKLTDALERVGRILDKKPDQVTAQELFDYNTAQRDIEIAQEAMDGYSDTPPQEQQNAYFRNTLRNLLYDPQIQQAAQKHGIPAEELANALIKKGMEGISIDGGRKKEEFILDITGRDKTVDPRKAARSRRLQEIAAEGTGGDDTIIKQLNEFDFWDE
jgi:hypothetical protein